MRRIFVPLLILVSAFLACSENSSDPGPVAKEYRFSFEKDAQGWEPGGTDLELGDSTIPWSVGRGGERATEGSWSMRLYLDNMNDAGKIWMQRAFTLDPNTVYTVSVAYDFATADYGDLNLFTIIAGAGTTPPDNGKGLVFQGTTGNGSDTDTGYRWLEKAYSFPVTTGADGRVYVVLGVWGTWETARTYFIDDVSVRFSEETE